MKTTINGQLEIDFTRGVIYFHSAGTGQTILRICQLQELKRLKKLEKLDTIDITHMFGCSVVINDMPKVQSDRKKGA